MFILLDIGELKLYRLQILKNPKTNWVLLRLGYFAMNNLFKSIASRVIFNSIFSLLIFAAIYKFFGSSAYYVFGIFTSVILAFKQLPGYKKTCEKEGLNTFIIGSYIFVFCYDILFWPAGIFNDIVFEFSLNGAKDKC
jgi:hypothetical protein